MGVVVVFLVSCIVCLSVRLLLRRWRSPSDLPPGTQGWPVIGETLEYLSTGRKGHPERFVMDRMERFSRRCFRTSIIGQRDVAVMCGADGNKFLFSNENRLVTAWWPAALKKVFSGSKANIDLHMVTRLMRTVVLQFLKPETLRRLVGTMDLLADRHFANSWEGNDEILVLPLAKRFTFWVACKLFLSLEDPDQITRLFNPFLHLTSGFVSFPINLPGTSFNRAIKAMDIISKELKEVIKQRKLDLANNKATPTQDLLSYLLTTPSEAETGEQRFMNEDFIATTIVTLIFAGHDPTSVTITFIVKYLAELPHVYDRVYQEQMEIARAKEKGELLTWDDIQRMKYSWNVACEAMRLSPFVQGIFREALHDFTYAGYRIPKGWKLYLSANSTHHDPGCFPDPDKFDPSRFEGSGPTPNTFIPFGGGPRMCLGQVFARLEILVFMHHLVKRFKWKKLIPDEKIIVDPLPKPAKGLPIRVLPHNAST